MTPETVFVGVVSVFLSGRGGRPHQTGVVLVKYAIIAVAVIVLLLAAISHPALLAITVAAAVAAVYATRSDKPSV